MLFRDLATAGSLQVRGASRLTLPLALSVAWLLLVAWRPYSFGFYHDDWPTVVMADRVKNLFELFHEPSRPLYLFSLYGLRLVLGPSAWAWQAALALLHLLSAWGVARAVHALPGSERETTPSVWPGLLAGVAWLAFPWSLGYSAWPVMLPPLLGMTAAIWSLVLVAGNPTRGRLVASGLLLCVGWTVYEATWFFWFPWAFLIILTARDGPMRRSFWLYFGCIAAVQVFVVVANRLLAATTTTSKHFTGQVVSTLETGQRLLQEELATQLEGVGAPLAVALLALLVLAMNVAVRRRSLSVLLLQCGACLAGIAVAVLLYAAAGYAIQWQGLFSRTTMPISFWLAMLIGGFLRVTESSGTVSRWLARSAGGLACAAFAIALIRESHPWQESWKEQRAVVAAFPAEVLNLANPQTLMLMDLPRGAAPVYGFSAFWDISGALMSRLPRSQTNSPVSHAYATVIREPELRTTWDGEFVRQAWCTSPNNILWKLPAQRVFVWRYPGNEVVPVAPGFVVGCNEQPK
jgi:hypothetical protein